MLKKKNVQHSYKHYLCYLIYFVLPGDVHTIQRDYRELIICDLRIFYQNQLSFPLLFKLVFFVFIFVIAENTSSEIYDVVNSQRYYNISGFFPKT